MRSAFLAASLLLLSACGGDGDTAAPAAEETDVPEELRTDNAGKAAPDGGEQGEEIDGSLGTPMAERVATIGLLNKRNNISQELEMKPGESRRVGDVVVRMSACERTAPWEMPQETGAFVQVLVRNNADEWGKVFSGWLFKRSPSVNVVEHPVYDVWVKDCAMSFPGEEDTASASDSSEA